MKTIKNSDISRLMRYLKPYRVSLGVVFILILISLAGVSAAPYVEGLITTQLLSDVTNSLPVNFPVIYRIAVILIGIYTLTNVARVVLQFMLTKSIQSAIFTMRLDIKKKISRLPVSYFDHHPTGTILSTITTDVEAISNALQQSLFQVVNTVFGLLFAAVMMFTIDVQMALIGIAVIPLGLLSARFIIRKSQKVFSVQQNALANLNGVVQEMYTGFSEIKLFNREQQAIETFTQTNDNLRKNGFKALFISGLMNPVVSLLTYIAIASAIMVGILKVIDGVLAIGLVQAFIRYCWSENQYISQVTQLSSTIQSSFAAMNRVFAFLDQPEETPDVTHADALPQFKGDVTFDHVSFSYTDQPLIKDFSVNVKSGQTVAIVGPTGAGKTTMINLLMRFYDVDQGAIRVDGVDIREMSRDKLRSHFGMVLQDTWLFSGTIKENLLYGNPEATDEEIIKAAKETNVNHWIKTLPHGYDSQINEEASNMSNGEKQLLTITRALLSDPQILILDEATSSVDTRLEALIQNAMNVLLEGRTSFVIAHRLSTIRNSDLILVMQNGQIIEQGNHESLLEQGGFYAVLYQSQFAQQTEEI